MIGTFPLFSLRFGPGLLCRLPVMAAIVTQRGSAYQATPASAIMSTRLRKACVARSALGSITESRERQFSLRIDHL